MPAVPPAAPASSPTRSLGGLSGQRVQPWRDPSAKPMIQIQEVRKTFGDFVAVDGVSVDIYPGELFALLGGSGCGKTTLLRMLAGFETPTEGRILIDGQDMANVPPYARPANMMFQSYALFPHMNVEANVGFGLRMDGVAKGEIAARVAEALELVQMTPFAKRKPHQLSGGQRQRVALARSLIKRPKVLLLDEPLGALDKKLREQTQLELLNIQSKVGITFVIVTHDQEEAMTLADRISVMDRGRIQQLGTPAEIYEFPKNRFVANFIGSVNLFEATLAVDEPDRAELDSIDFGQRIHVGHGVTGTIGMEFSVAVRPEKIRMSRKPLPDLPNQTQGVIKQIVYLGDISTYFIETASGKQVRVTQPNLDRWAEGEFTWEDRVYIGWAADGGVVLAQ
ncbi:polyamine-transporting ATPase [Elstera cyanobacteriorum]|uniref:Spermidine/putrescine import ATP-binding protein PotA n=2 Tax=Elstera cyanobacteriorum TaxID=2022747 RepID=A0A255XJV3_9PROT|nr:polyamine ABC transporter ATP-binding protein [Elstera cyanobacteriorum]GFZ88049.1 polyamine-transporting ATPase [Elstera cyanobacteriorum]